MDEPKRMVIVDKDGVHGDVNTDRPLESDAKVLVRFDDKHQALVPFQLLVRRNDGSYYLPLSFSEFEHSPGPVNVSEHEGDSIVIPVIQEQAHLEKRTVETGRVRITKQVHEREEVVDEALFEEEVEIKRVVVNRVVDQPVSVRYEGETMIVPLLKEVLVVQKQLMVEEELHITKKRKEKRSPKRVTLRSEDVIVKRLDVLEPSEIGTIRSNENEAHSISE